MFNKDFNNDNKTCVARIALILHLYRSCLSHAVLVLLVSQ